MYPSFSFTDLSQSQLRWKSPNSYFVNGSFSGNVMIGLKCSVEGCEKDARTRGLCWTHDFSQKYQTDPKFRGNRNKTKRDYNRRLLQTYRDAIAEGLGGWKCVICCVADRDVLSFDHKDGGGENEKKGWEGNYPQSVTIITTGKAKERLQVLCANCNWKKNAPRYGQGRSRTAVWQRTARVALIDLLGGRKCCLLYTSPSPRDLSTSRMPSSA